MSDIIEWLRNSNSDEWCSGQLLKAADEIQRLRTELKESRRLFVRDTDEYIKWTDEAKVEIKKLKEALKALAEHCNNMEAQNHDYHTMGEGGAPRLSEPLANAYDAIRESRDD